MADEFDLNLGFWPVSTYHLNGRRVLVVPLFQISWCLPLGGANWGWRFSGDGAGRLKLGLDGGVPGFVLAPWVRSGSMFRVLNLLANEVARFRVHFEKPITNPDKNTSPRISQTSNDP
eukprot:sb/3476454/